MTAFTEFPGEKTPSPCILVIFGATGDLTHRKLVPALYNLSKDGLLPAHFACVGFARREKTNEIFRSEMRQGVDEFSRTKPANPDLWQKLPSDAIVLEVVASWLDIDGKEPFIKIPNAHVFVRD